MNWISFLILMMIGLSVSLTPNEIVIFILSQQDFIELAQNLRSDIYNQSILISRNHLINVHLLHETFNHNGHWTFLAILPLLATTNLIKLNTKWIILCEDQSKMDLKILLNELQKEDYKQEIYLGHSLYDREASIIHHFAFFEHPQWFPYPMIKAGVAFSVPLIKRLTKRVLDEKPNTDFFIDASHELSLFIWQNMRIENRNNNSNNNNKKQNSSSKKEKEIENSINSSGGNNNSSSGGASGGSSKPQNVTGIVVTDGQPEKNNNIKIKTLSKSNPWGVKTSKLYKGNEQNILLTTASYLCSKKGYGCAIYPNILRKTCTPINAASIYFAIKTCQKFHNERIPAIETTWGRYAIHKNYFSDVQDQFIPTISTNVPNTEIGHCTKTLNILRIALTNIERLNYIHKIKIQWIFLSDDDTLLSVSGVCNILGCFNATNDVYLGERYGYRLHSKDGFNYITGGGGIVFSLITAKKIINSCTCPTISSPDDMIIGSCLQELGVKAIHSSKFHQARPIDYSQKLLLADNPISFHKFWQIDPNYLYTKWFEKFDKKISIQLQKIHNNNISSNNCNYVYSCIGSICTKTKKKLKNLKNQQELKQQHNNVVNSRRKLQEHSEFYTTFKSKFYHHIDL